MAFKNYRCGKRNVTRNSSGQIDFNEFLEMMRKFDPKIEEDVTHHAFRYKRLAR